MYVHKYIHCTYVCVSTINKELKDRSIQNCRKVDVLCHQRGKRMIRRLCVDFYFVSLKGEFEREKKERMQQKMDFGNQATIKRRGRRRGQIILELPLNH